MLFPIGDDQVKGGNYPLFSYAFIVLNIIVFLYQISMPPPVLEQFIQHYSATPREIMAGDNWYSLFTSMFLHGGWGHLIGNMLFLWVFADNIESTIGNFRFLLFYIVGGLAAHALHIGLAPASTIPTVGASGAISAVMGAYLVMFPQSRVKVFFFFLIFRVSAFIFLGIWIWMQWSSGMSALRMDSSGGGVAYWAHIGGFIFGVLTGIYYRVNYGRPKVVDPEEDPYYRRDDFV